MTKGKYNTSRSILRELVLKQGFKMSAIKEGIYDILAETKRFKLVDERQYYTRLQVVKPVGRRKVSVEIKQGDNDLSFWVVGNPLHPDASLSKTDKYSISEMGFKNEILEVIANLECIRKFSDRDANGHDIPYFGAILKNNEPGQKEKNLITRVSNAAVRYHSAINSLNYNKTLENYIKTITKLTESSVTRLLLD